MNDQLTAEQEMFEQHYPIPPNCARHRGGYSATSFNAWEAHAFINKWEGWKARSRSCCPHGIHWDNACGACIPPRGTSIPTKVGSEPLWDNKGNVIHAAVDRFGAERRTRKAPQDVQTWLADAQAHYVQLLAEFGFVDYVRGYGDCIARINGDRPARADHILVPIEPPVEVLENGSIASDYDVSQDTCRKIWKAMIDYVLVQNERAAMREKQND